MRKESGTAGMRRSGVRQASGGTERSGEAGDTCQGVPAAAMPPDMESVGK